MKARERSKDLAAQDPAPESDARVPRFLGLAEGRSSKVPKEKRPEYRPPQNHGEGVGTDTGRGHTDKNQTRIADLPPKGHSDLTEESVFYFMVFVYSSTRD